MGYTNRDLWYSNSAIQTIKFLHRDASGDIPHDKEQNCLVKPHTHVCVVLSSDRYAALSTKALNSLLITGVIYIVSILQKEVSP